MGRVEKEGWAKARWSWVRRTKKQVYGVFPEILHLSRKRGRKNGDTRRRGRSVFSIILTLRGLEVDTFNLGRVGIYSLCMEKNDFVC